MWMETWAIGRAARLKYLPKNSYPFWPIRVELLSEKVKERDSVTLGQVVYHFVPSSSRSARLPLTETSGKSFDKCSGLRHKSSLSQSPNNRNGTRRHSRPICALVLREYHCRLVLSSYKYPREIFVAFCRVRYPIGDPIVIPRVVSLSSIYPCER